jgi:hypothetical protein
VGLLVEKLKINVKMHGEHNVKLREGILEELMIITNSYSYSYSSSSSSSSS